MQVPHRDRRWIWAGRVTGALVLVGLAGYLVHVGLDDADKVASSVSVVIALAALLAPYLLPALQPAREPMPGPDQVEDSGNATATGGGQANTGTQAAGRGGPTQVRRSGDAVADGSGSVANTGIRHQPEPGP
jgi:hypothetical protein